MQQRFYIEGLKINSDHRCSARRNIVRKNDMQMCVNSMADSADVLVAW